MFKTLNKLTDGVITVYIDELPVQAHPNDTAATVLLRQPSPHARTSPISGARRAPYCMMGVCFDCLAIVDGALVQTCLAPVRDGMHIRRQQGRRSVTP